MFFYHFSGHHSFPTSLFLNPTLSFSVCLLPLAFMSTLAFSVHVILPETSDCCPGAGRPPDVLYVNRSKRFPALLLMQNSARLPCILPQRVKDKHRYTYMHAHTHTDRNNIYIFSAVRRSSIQAYAQNH